MKAYEEEYVPANGIEHYLLYYPKAAGTPVLLYLHGGPGNFESLFAYEMDQVWGDLFTHVHWDQRGAGKTLRRNGKACLPESVDQMLCDLHGIILHLRQKFEVDKVVLLGHSWGTVLGSLYALKHPEYVAAYIGVGQVVSIVENERIAYRNVLGMAREAGNEKHVRMLERMGDYPPEDPELLLKLLPKLRKIQEAYDHDTVSGFGLGEMIRTACHSPSFQWGDFISFMRIMKVNRPLHLGMFQFQLGDIPPHYQMPVHYILGEADNITPLSLGKAYFDTIHAPCKTFTMIPGAGHNAMYERPEEFAAALAKVRESLQQS